MKKLQLSKKLTIKDIVNFLKHKPEVSINPTSRKRVIICRQWLDNYLNKNQQPVYGINTGFASLCNVCIQQDELEKLQENLLLSHACSVGEELPPDIVRLMMLLKIQNASLGYSALQLETIELLCKFLNYNIIPVVNAVGSLGASGDLAPLAQMCLPLIGKGYVYYNNEKLPSRDALELIKLKPTKLKAKEGLALLNGTQYMQALGLLSVIKANKLSEWADTIAAISLDAYLGQITPFHEQIQLLRPYPGQIETAKKIQQLLKDSKIQTIQKDYVQDPYSFRCIPQVHGATKDVIKHVIAILEIEINAVTDNPTVLSEVNQIISAGNFHGQPLAMAYDYLAIACAEIASISERRIYRLLEGKRNLPSYLIANPGLNSGFMISHYTTAALVSENKILCHPASVDSIESSQGQEDHVSMGANAGLKLGKVIENSFNVLAIELMVATQALNFRRPLKTSPILEKIIQCFRKNVPFVENDTILYPLIKVSRKFLDENNPYDFI